MNIKKLACIVVAALTVFGCAAQTGVPGGARTTKPCPGASCDVQVWVNAQGMVEADADLRVPRGNRDVVIVWKLINSPQYEFRRDSIVPHTGAAIAMKKTPTSQATWDGQITFLRNSAVTVVVQNGNSQAVDLYYDITVYNKMTGAPVKLDPVIFNEGD